MCELVDVEYALKAAFENIYIHALRVERNLFAKLLLSSHTLPASYVDTPNQPIPR